MGSSSTRVSRCRKLGSAVGWLLDGVRSPTGTAVSLDQVIDLDVSLARATTTPRRMARWETSSTTGGR